MLIGQQAHPPGGGYDRVKKTAGHGMRRQLLAIQIEGAVLKAWFIQTHIQKPANEEVGVQPFRKQPALRTEYSVVSTSHFSNCSCGIEGCPRCCTSQRRLATPRST